MSGENRCGNFGWTTTGGLLQRPAQYNPGAEHWQ